MLETCDRLTEEREPALQQYLLLAGALRSLAGKEHDPDLVLDAYLLRALAVAGWAPSFHDCARCGAPGPHRGVQPRRRWGRLLRYAARRAPRRPRRRRSCSLSALLAGDWAVADASDPGTAGRAAASPRRSCSGTSSAASASLRMVER